MSNTEATATLQYRYDRLSSKLDDATRAIRVQDSRDHNVPGGLWNRRYRIHREREPIRQELIRRGVQL